MQKKTAADARTTHKQTNMPHHRLLQKAEGGCSFTHSLATSLTRSPTHTLTPRPPGSKPSSQEKRKQKREEGERKRKCHPSTQPRVRNRFGSKVVTSWWLQPCWAECRWRRCCVQRTRRGRTLGRVQSGGGMLGRHALAVLGDLDRHARSLAAKPVSASCWR